MTKEVAWKTMSQFESELSNRMAKWRRNYRAYYNAFVGETLTNAKGQPLGFYYTVDEYSNTPPPIINMIQSTVDAVVSQMSEVKVRPFFEPINGTYKTRKAARQTQLFMDELFERNNVYIDGPEALRSALIFEQGAIWVNDIECKFQKIRPWEFFYSQNEYQYGKLSCCGLKFDEYPSVLLKKRFMESKKPGIKDKIDALNENPLKIGVYKIFYDLVDKIRFEYFDGYCFAETKIDFDVPPVELIYFKKPLKGAYSTSLADDIYPIQLQINAICTKIGQAIALSPANVTYVPKGQGQIKASTIQSDAGIVYEFTPIPNAPPITFVAPAPLDDQYLQLLNFFIDKALTQPGINEMTALGKRPKSLQSGSALETLEDITSNRQNPILNAYISLLTRLAKTAIQVFPKDQEVLPVTARRSKVTWGQVKEQRDMFSIQVSASSSLSKDPKTKIDQIMNLVTNGFLDKSLAMQYLEMPDLEDAYSVISSTTDYNRFVIERAVEEDRYDFFEITDIPQLFKLSVDELLRCAAASEDQQYVERLAKLIKVISSIKSQLTPPAPVQPQVNQAPQQGQ